MMSLNIVCYGLSHSLPNDDTIGIDTTVAIEWYSHCLSKLSVTLKLHDCAKIHTHTHTHN